MIKALATDLDGTLLRDNKVPVNNQNALKDLKKDNNLFIISTGRPYNGVRYLIEEYNLEVDYNILLNGALIIDRNNNVINHKVIPFSTVSKIIESLKENNPKVSVETGYITYTLDPEANNLPYDGKKAIDSLNDIENEDLSLISLYFKDAKDEKIDEICAQINETYSSSCVAFRNTQYIDVVPLGCSKGNAVKFVCEKENIHVDNIYTIGDSFNDVSMFNITENSFTFTECGDNLKTHAEYVVDSVAECINNHILNKSDTKLNYSSI